MVKLRKQLTVYSSTCTVLLTHKMANGRPNRDEYLAKRWHSIVKNARAIHRWELKDQLGISVNDYYRMSSYILYRFDDIVYNKQSQQWESLSTPMEEAKEIMEAKVVQN